MCVWPLKRASNFVLVSSPQRGDSVTAERLQGGRRGVRDAALLCNVALWTAARPGSSLAAGWRELTTSTTGVGVPDFSKNLRTTKLLLRRDLQNIFFP